MHRPYLLNPPGVEKLRFGSPLTFLRLTAKIQDCVTCEEDVDAVMREVRMALLEADVHYSVVKGFVARVRERSVGAEVSKALNPAQQVIKIVHEELIATLGEPTA
jgi:signal recognition particle GTPase